MSVDLLWNGLTGNQILAMMPSMTNMSIDDDDNHAVNKMMNCKYSLGLDQNLEFYFSSNEKLSSKRFFENFFSNNSDTPKGKKSSTRIKQVSSNLLNLRKLQSLCDYDRKFVAMLADWNKIRDEQVCYFSLPLAISALNNKTSCQQLVQSDVDYFVNVMSKCYTLYEQGLLYATAEEHKKKSDIMALLTKDNLFSLFVKNEAIQHHVCFKKNLMHVVYEHLVDKEFVNQFAESEPKQLEIKITSLIVFNINDAIKIENRTDTRLVNENSVYQFYLKYFHGTTYQEKETQILGIYESLFKK